MRSIYKVFSVLVILLITSFTAVSAGGGGGEFGNTNEERQKNYSEFMLHHVVDDHEWEFFGNIHLHLPIILIDGGIKTFSSSVFSENTPVQVILTDSTPDYYGLSADKTYGMFHGRIYKTIDGALQFDKEGHPTNDRPLDFSITKNVATLFICAFLVFIIFTSIGKAYKKQGVNSAPKGLQGFMEPLILFVRDEIARPNIGEKKYEQYMPYLLTVFFLIWIINLFGLVPFLGGVNLSGNISFTLVLALFTYLITQFSGNKYYWKHILMPPVPWPLYIIMIPVEIIGTLTKPFALMIRLFANITAGHIVVLAFMGIIFVNQSYGWSALSLPMGLFISVLELLVAFLQAFIFTMLSALFIGSAVEEAHH